MFNGDNVLKKVIYWDGFSSFCVFNFCCQKLMCYYRSEGGTYFGWNKKKNKQANKENPIVTGVKKKYNWKWFGTEIVNKHITAEVLYLSYNYDYYSYDVKKRLKKFEKFLCFNFSNNELSLRTFEILKFQKKKQKNKWN